MGRLFFWSDLQGETLCDFSFLPRPFLGTRPNKLQVRTSINPAISVFAEPQTPLAHLAADSSTRANCISVFHERAHEVAHTMRRAPDRLSPKCIVPLGAKVAGVLEARDTAPKLFRWAPTFSGAALRKVALKKLQRHKSRDPRPACWRKLLFHWKQKDDRRGVFRQFHFRRISTAIFLDHLCRPYK